MHDYNGLEIAVIGLAGRFPGANTIAEYWDNLKNGVHCIQTFSESELLAAGVDPRLVAREEYVKAKGYLDGGNRFDARFFDYTPLEAELMDPQMKVFHECVWAALEDAGYAAQVDRQLIGLFAGASPNHVWEGLMGLSGKSEVIGHWAATQLIDKDYVSLRIAHKLNLKGPALSIYTACSTSLVAVHMAAQSLLNGECDMALAGGVTVTLPGKSGYEYQEGMILSPDGKCRAFDANGKGIVGGDGAGVVVLKRLQDAIDDRDQIYAVIKGSAVNNDGLQKTGFTAPSTIGQAEVIRTALKVAEVSPETIDYIECHGTGTPLGDPIELEALELAYNPEQKHTCALGSVKTNIGHLDSAAGIASFIKTVLAVKHRLIPPSLHFQTPNPTMNVVEKGFYINDKLTEWPKTNKPIRAGISAFGIGGTNAHVIIEQAPPKKESSSGREWQLLPISAKTKPALTQYKKELERYFKTELNRRIEDIAYTLQLGRKHFPIRELVMINRKSSQVVSLSEGTTKAYTVELENPPVIFMFPDFSQRKRSEGEQAKFDQLVQEEPVVGRILDQAIEIIKRHVPGQVENLWNDENDQVLLFIRYYAVAKLIMEWGITPETMAGVGKGEWLAACLSGDISLEVAIPALLKNHEDRGFEHEGIKPLISHPDVIYLTFGTEKELQPLLDKGRSGGRKVVELEQLNAYSLMNAVGSLWLYGKEIDWREFYKHEQRNRVSLPTYTFDRQEYLIDKELFNLEHLVSNHHSNHRSALTRKEDIRNWFYVPAWESSSLPNHDGVTLPRDATWLVFSDQTGLGVELIKYLNDQQIRCIIVEQAEDYQQISEDHYRVNPLHTEELDQMYQSLEVVPDHICYLWTITPPTEPELANIDRGQQLCFHHILKLVQYIGSKAITREVRLQIASNGVYSITQEEVLCPMKGLLLGASKIIPYEYPNIKVCHVDFQLAVRDEARKREQVLQMIREIQFDFPNKQVAYRGKSRWVESVKEPLLLKSPKELSLLKENLVCMITGGLGGMGFALAEYLAKQYKARLVLVGRSSFPPREEWEEWASRTDDEKVSRTIRTILSLEEAGAMIEVHSVDISDYSAMQQVVEQAEARLGPITGVLHTAGVPDYAGVIQRRTKEMTDAVLLPKVKGTIVLDTLFRNRKLDFFVLFSSIGNYIYGRKFGQVGYNAANEFLDAFAHYRLQHREGYTATINWNDWAEVGMSVKAMEKNRSLNKEVNDTQFAAEAITTEQGVNVFRYIMENQWNRAIVSVLDLPALMEESNNISEEALLEKEAATAAHAVEMVHVTIDSGIPLTVTELEQKIAEIWTTVLGIAAIGEDEDFFGLGGDSLKAITIISLVFKKLGVKLPLPAFFNKPTIREMARLIQEVNQTNFTPIKQAPKKEGYPLTSGQKRLYFLNQMEKENKQYNNIIALHVKGPLNFAKLETCLNRLIGRHESLRTCFQRIDGELVQVIREDVSLTPDYVEINEAVNNTDIEAWIQPFDLETAPLCKVGIFKESEQNHLIVFNIHHIITDGTSNAILIDEFTTLYQYDGEINALPPLAIQYKDYAEWRNEKTNDSYEADQAYWLETFSGDIPLLHLPADFSRPTFKTYQGNTEIFTIPKEQVQEIKKAAAEHEATLYMFLFAAWNTLLAKLSDQEDIVVGVPTSGRNHSDIQHLIGMFVNTIPIRSVVSKERTFAELLLAIKENMSNALEHQDYPFEDLVSQIQVSRDFGRNPLFDVMFAFQNTDAQQRDAKHVQLNDLQIQPYPYKPNTSRFDLTLDGEERAGELVFTLEYSTELFKKETVIRFIQYFQNIIQEALAQPTRKISQISLLDEQEMNLLLTQFNQTAGEYPAHLMVHQVFEARVKEHPDKIAIKFHDETMTYHELDSRANQVAYALKAQGIGPNQIVGLIATRSFEMLLGMFAILKAGGAYLPIDPSLPPNRIAYMLDDCQVQVVLTNTTVEIERNLIVLDMRKSEMYQGVSSHPVPLNNNSRDLAYCMYTSGTTGLPKGILIEHRSLLNFLYGMTDVLSLREEEKFLSLTTVSFDIFWLESILPLLAGLQVVIADENDQKDVSSLANLVKQAEISVLQTTPSRLKLLLADSELAEQLSSLRYLLIGGEPLPQSLAEQARNVVRNGRIVNLYGPTETTIWSTVKEVTTGQVNIGRPIKNTQVYILNDERQPQPIGVPGYLYIGGHGVARGYQNKPELTEEKFIDNPYRPGEKMYGTGDMAKWSTDGTLEFLGRNDFQVKIRGYRIEMPEIEKQLDTHPTIEKAIVTVQRDAQNEQMLVAYYTSEQTVSSHELRVFLRKQLPEYMVPQHFMQIKQIPLMINGKLDVKALPPAIGMTVEPKELHGPKDEVETKLYDIWRNVLRIDHFGVCDRFFELGGNSIQIMQLVYEINKCFPVTFQFTHFIELQTIEAIARHVREALEEEQELELPVLTPDPTQMHEPFPLTNVQMAYYLGRSNRFELGGVSTHSYLEVVTELDIRRLNQCLNILIQRHPALRTIYLQDATQQILADVPEYQISVHDLRTYREEEKSELIAIERKRMSHDIFNPNVWPLFEIVAFRLTDKESLLCISFDLLIMDAYSLEILLKEIEALYEDLSLQLDDLSITFRDYISGYQQMKNSKWYLQDKEYWLQKVEDFPLAPEIPLQIQPIHVKNPYFKRKSKQYSAQHWRQLKEIAQKHNLTPSTVLCTAYAEILANWSNQLDFSLNLTLFNRLPFHPDVEKLVGDFTSLLLLEVRLNPSDSFWEKAGKVQRELMGALAHRHFDGIDVMREISKRRELGNKALMPIVFTSALFENAGEAAEEKGDASEREQSTNGITQTSQVYLDNQVALINGKLVINWDYISELFDPVVIDAIFDQYLSRIDAILNNREEMDFPAISASDRASIEAYNRTQESIPSKTLHGLFEEAAAKSPSAIAIEGIEESITYKELDERAGIVASYLQGIGVRPGDMIGVIAKKEIATFVNLLGILKSGAAYVPIDPEYPQERVAYIQSHSQCKFVLEPDFYERNHLEQHSHERKRSNAQPESLAYVIYTSGSTGNPKGVMIRHEAACNTILDINQKFQVGEKDRILSISSLCFDLSIYDIFGAFAAGATLVLVKDQKNMAQLADNLVAKQITIWNSVPAIMDRVCAEIKERCIYDYHNLRLVMLSGDWIPLNLPTTIKQLFPSSQVISLGGATEASIWSIYYPIDEVLPQWKSIPYGKPLANQQFYVLNQQMQFCPLEVPGELYIGGRGVADGYLYDHEKTSESFIRHPELGYIYRTGDYGVLHRNGYIEFLGRKDQQVKIGGYRIELGEVEAQLLRCEGIRNAVVLVAGGKEKRLHAYLIPQTAPADQEAFVQGIRAHLARALPDYMIPYHFVIMEHIPLTANGKVDVQALLQLQPTSKKQAPTYVAPRNEAEGKIVNVFKEILDTKQVGVLDNFFEMGINSIQIAMINNRLKQEFQKEIPLLSMFEYANIHALADYLAGNDQNQADDVQEEKVNAWNQGKERMKQRSARRRGQTDRE